MSALRNITNSLPGRSFVVRSLRYIRRVLVRHFGPRVQSVQSYPEVDFLKLFAFEMKSEKFDPLSPDAVRELLRHYERRVGIEWPAIPDALTDLRIDISRMTAEEIVERADEALAGKLHPSGLKPLLTKEGQIDWATNPSNSREWLLMIHRHAWWPLWGAAYQRTGDEKYAQAFVTQLVDWLDQHPLPQQKSENLESWRLMEVGLRMRISWIPSFGCFYSSPTFTDSAKLLMLRAIYDHGQYLHQFFTNRNHLVRESNGLIAVGLCFPEFRKSAEWIETGLHRLDVELQDQVNEDGSHIEMSVGYQWLTIDEFEATRGLLDKYQRKLPVSDLDDTLHRLYEFLAAIIRPDRTFPQLNDGFILWDAERLAAAGRRYGWRDIEHVASGGESGSLPDYCSRSFPNAGIHIMRSDWTPGARYLIADTGPYGGPHGHEDKLSFELFAHGAPFIVDSGSYTYAKNDPYRDYFVGSQGHNNVLVDQRSQVRRWDSKHMTPVVQDVNHGIWRSSSDFEFASGRYDEGWAPFSLSKPADMNVNFDVIHQRDFIFAKPNYWVIADYLDGNELHQYTFLFHLAPDVLVEDLTGSTALLKSGRNGAQLIISAYGDKAIRSQIIEGSESPIQGWYSEDHHKKCASPVLSFDIRESRSAFVIWVLYPLRPGVDAGQMRRGISHEQDADQHVINVQCAGNLDSVSIRNDPRMREGTTGKSRSRISAIRDGNEVNFP